MSSRGVGAVIAVIAVLVLSACTGVAPGSPASSPAAPAASESADRPGDDGQSTADACALVQAAIQDATERFENADAGDAAEVVEAMTAAGDELAQTADAITNDEVAALVPRLQSMFSEVAAVMTAIAQGDATRLEDFGALGEEFRMTGEAFQEVCSP